VPIEENPVSTSQDPQAVPPAAPTAASKLIPSKPASSSPRGFNTTEFYFGAATAAGCMTIAAEAAAPPAVRCSALAAAALIAVAYAFGRHSAKRGGSA